MLGANVAELSEAALSDRPNLDSEVTQLTTEYRKEQLPTHELLSQPLFIFTVILCNFPSCIIFKPAHSEYVTINFKEKVTASGWSFPPCACIITV